MDKKERILETQEFTQNYFKTAELLDISYDEVRSVCEEEEWITDKIMWNLESTLTYIK